MGFFKLGMDGRLKRPVSAGFYGVASFVRLGEDFCQTIGEPVEMLADVAV